MSLDQAAVEKLSPDTRFKSLSLSTGAGAVNTKSLSWTANGVNIPAEDRPSQLFQRMFVTGTPAEIATQVQRLKQGESIMDAVLQEANAFQNKLGGRDREKLDEYFTAVREVEQRLVSGQEWATRPKPKVEATPPAATTAGTCRSWSPAADSGTGSTWPSIRASTRRCATSTRSFSGGSVPT
jgi:hypothetical protein